MACKKRRNSILIKSTARRTLGKSKPNHAFRFQAREVITIAGPIAEQIVHRHAHGVDPIFELLDDVLLIAASVGQANDLLACVIEAVGDIKKVTDLIEENLLALLHADVLAYDDESIGVRAFEGLIVDFGNILTYEHLVLIALEAHDTFFDPLGLRRGAVATS